MVVSVRIDWYYLGFRILGKSTVDSWNHKFVIQENFGCPIKNSHVRITTQHIIVLRVNYKKLSIV